MMSKWSKLSTFTSQKISENAKRQSYYREVYANSLRRVKNFILLPMIGIILLISAIVVIALIPKPSLKSLDTDAIKDTILDAKDSFGKYGTKENDDKGSSKSKKKNRSKLALNLEDSWQLGTPDGRKKIANDLIVFTSRKKTVDKELLNVVESQEKITKELNSALSEKDQLDTKSAKIAAKREKLKRIGKMAKSQRGKGKKILKQAIRAQRSGGKVKLSATDQKIENFLAKRDLEKSESLTATPMADGIPDEGEDDELMDDMEALAGAGEIDDVDAEEEYMKIVEELELTDKKEKAVSGKQKIVVKKIKSLRKKKVAIDKQVNSTRKSKDNAEQNIARLEKWNSKHKQKFDKTSDIGSTTESDDDVSDYEKSIREQSDLVNKIDTTLVKAKHVEGQTWLKRAKTKAEEKDIFAAKSMAAHALGFKTFEPNKMEISESSSKSHNALLKAGTIEAYNALKILNSDPNVNLIWQKSFNAIDGVYGPVLFTPNGHQFAVSEDQNIRFINIADEEKSFNITESSLISTYTISPDGLQIAVATDTKEINLWDIKTKSKRLNLTQNAVDFEKLLFVPYSHSLVSLDIDSEIKVWNLNNPKEGARTIKGYGYKVSINDISISIDGTVLASANENSTVCLWSLATGKLLNTLIGHSAPVTKVDFAQNGLNLLSTSEDGTARIWRLSSGSTKSTIDGISSYISDIYYSKNGRILVTAGGDGITLWDAGRNSKIALLSRYAKRGTSISLSPDGITLAVRNDDSVKLWSISRQKSLKVADSGKSIMSPNLLPNWLQKSYYINGIREKKQLNGHTGPAFSLNFSNNDRALVSAGKDKKIILWDAVDGSERGILKRYISGFFSAVFNLDNTILASAGFDGSVTIWDIKNASLKQTLNRHTKDVFCVRYSPNGQLLASGSKDKTIIIWSTNPYEKQLLLEGHEGTVIDLAFSPDGKTLCSASLDKTIKFWNISNGTEVATLQGHTGAVNSIMFNSKGTILASGSKDSSIKLWDVETTKELNTLNAHDGTVYSVCFSPNDQTLTSGGSDKKIRFWDLSTNAIRSEIQLPGKQIISMCYNSNGSLLATAHADKNPMIWEIGENLDIDFGGFQTKVEVGGFSVMQKTATEVSYYSNVCPNSHIDILRQDMDPENLIQKLFWLYYKAENWQSATLLFNDLPKDSRHLENIALTTSLNVLEKIADAENLQELVALRQSQIKMLN